MGQASTPGQVLVRTSESVSMRKIAFGSNTTAPVSLSNVADRRGIKGDFALRELITPQTVDGLSNIRGSEETWRNWLNDYASSGTLPYKPKTVDDVRQIVLSSARDGKKVRAVGAGHSHSRAASPDENYIDLYRYNGGPEGLVGTKPTRPHISDPKNATHYKPPAGNHTTYQDLGIVRVMAGSMLKYINRDLLKNDTSEFNDGYGLLNMGAYDEQTLAGAINTGTHGTGRHLGTLADAVLSVEMATVMESPARPGDPTVRLFRIEPEDGITERRDFENKVGSHEMALIQDDDIFHSVVVGYGAMGVATSYTLKVRKNYFLTEQTTTETWTDIKGDPDKKSGPDKGFIWEKLDDPNVRHLQVFVNIAETVGDSGTDDPSCMVRWHELKLWTSKPSGWPSGQFAPAWPPRRTSKWVLDITRKIRDWTAGAGVDPKTPNPGLAGGINSYFEAQKEAFKDPTIFTDRKDSAWYIALRRRPDKNYNDPAKPANDPDPAMTTEVAVPIDQVEEAVDTVIKTVQEVNKDDDMYYMAPLGIRFVAPSDHILSAEYDEGKRSDGVAMLELTFTVASVKGKKVTNRAKALSSAGSVVPGLILTAAQVANLLPDRNITQQRMIEYSKTALKPVEEKLIEEHDGRPHMGKYNTLSYQDLDNMYGRLSTWEAVNEQFNPLGTFDNKFTRHLGLDQNQGP